MTTAACLLRASLASHSSIRAFESGDDLYWTMQQALDVLRSAIDLSSSHDAGSSTYSSSAAAVTQEGVSALKRIKHALIGNSSRKVELAGRPDDVKR